MDAAVPLDPPGLRCPDLCASPLHALLRQQAVTREEGESIEKLHSRYVQALMALGREHGVQLALVE